MISLKEKRAAFKRLPEKLQDSIFSNETIEKVEIIAKKFNFSEVQKDLLDSEIMLLMMGLLDSTLFIANLQKNLGLDEKTSLAVNHEVEIVIIAEIRDFIPKMKLPEPNTVSQVKNISSTKTEVRSETKISFLGSGANLIEDVPGNVDNILPELPGEREVSRAPAPTAVQPASAFVPKQPTVKQKPEPALTDAEWEARKKALEAGELVMKTAYGQKPDPYREPTN